MNLAFIGGGNMATSLIGGLIADGYDPQTITVADINQAQLDYLQQRFGIRTSTSASEAAEGASVIVLSVKPQAIKSVSEQLADSVKKQGSLVVSVAAGIRTVDIDRWLGGNAAIVRAMPNTPALVQCGASGLFANNHVSAEQRETAESILRATGIALWVDNETDMNTVTALSGSGPAYFFRIMESMEAAAIKLGLPKNTARLLTLQTAMGAAKMALENPGDLASLRESVTSPGGTTEQGLRTMNENDIDKLISAVLKAAHDRSVELADQLGDS
jgi:pyrroline-5-carboxylate reductase